MSTLIDAITNYAVIAAVFVLALAVLVGLLGYLRSHLPKRQNKEQKKRGRFLVWGSALSASTVLAVVVVFTQVPFYEELFGSSAVPLPELLPWLNLVYLTPIALESLAWVFTVMSVFAVVNDKPSARYERLMWALSSVAALVNAGHNIATGKAVTGLVLGGFSVAGPMLVHYALRWDRDAQSDLTTEDFRRAAIARVVFVARRSAQIARHPVHSWRTVSIATNLGCSWDQAYRVALLGQYDAVHGVMVQQFERSLSSVHDPAIEAGNESAHSVQEKSDAPVHGPVGPDVAAPCTDPVVGDLGLLDDTSALFAKWGLGEIVHGEGARTTTSENDDARTDVHGPVLGPEAPSARRAQAPEDGRAHGSQGDVHGAARKGAQDGARPQKKSARTPRQDSAREVVHAHSERQEHVAARHWWQCTNAGTNPRARTNAEVAQELGINPSAVSRGFKWAEGGFNPDEEVAS